MTAYYNENDPYAAQWLRNLIAKGLIAPGDVDDRSINDVRRDDLAGYTQCHFFAGIGGWSVALRMAGWADERPVWTGSCPCQPFSAAGKQEGFDDPRHLWPAWFPLIAECAPAVVFGEQVAAAIGGGWLDAVFTDLEREGYACGAAVLPACGIGAPHIRQRAWFVAYSDGRDACAEGLQRGGQYGQRPEDSGAGSNLAHAESRGLRELGHATQPRQGGHADCGIVTDELGHAHEPGSQGRWIDRDGSDQQPSGPASVADYWANAEFIPCTDGKARPIEPGTFPLAHGVRARPSKLRAYGNAIVPQIAAAFIEAAA